MEDEVKYLRSDFASLGRLASLFEIFLLFRGELVADGLGLLDSLMRKERAPPIALSVIEPAKVDRAFFVARVALGLPVHGTRRPVAGFVVFRSVL